MNIYVINGVIGIISGMHHAMVDSNKSAVSGIVLFLVETIIMIIAILTNALEVPKWFVLLNPVGALPRLLIARKLNIKVGGAMGIGFTFYGIVLIVAGV